MEQEVIKEDQPDTPVTGHFQAFKKSVRYLKKLMHPETEVPAKPPRGPFRALKYTGRFAKNMIGANQFWTRYNAAQTGSLFLAQAAAGIAFMLTLTAVPAALGIVACTIFAGVGLYAIRYGLPSAWKTVEEVCAQTFPKLNPLKKIRESAARTSLGRKLLKRASKDKKTFLTQRQQDVILAGVTFEGAVFSSLVLGLGAAAVVPSVPIAAAIAAAATATLLIGKNAFDILCCVKTVRQAYKGYKKDKKLKKAARKNPQESFTIPQQQTEKSTLMQATAANAFNEQSGQQAEASSSAPRPVKSNAPPAHTA